MSTERYVALALALAFSILAWELIRYAVVGAASRLLRARVRRFVDAHRVQVDVFKSAGRRLVREELLNDLQVQEAILAAARAGEPPERARARVEEYIDEIAPRFSLTAYFQFGYLVARTALRLVYRIENDAASFEKLRALPPNASVMFLMNHRSNADYLLVAVALARRVAISFAIGEWARVFPLEYLFKLFGGYFLRRNFRDPLYHTVLRRYLQLIVRHGVTQGLFPEGGLSRDGRPREPKIGLLDAMVSMAAEPGFDREIVFVPVALNYDRVLEDRVLLREAKGATQPTRAEKLSSLARVAAGLVPNLVMGLARLVSGRLQRFGYASVSCGDPLPLGEFARLRGLTAASLAALPKEQRRAQVAALANEIMHSLSRATPATPVPLACRAILELGGRATAEELATRTFDLARRLRALGTPVILGRELQYLTDERTQLAADRDVDLRRPELAALEEQLIDAESARESTRIGLERLQPRGVVLLQDGVFSIAPGQEPVVRYYAGSLAALPEDPQAAVA